MMKTIFTALLSIFIAGQAAGQDPWKIEAASIDPGNYYGETVANGMLGLVSSAQPLQLSSTVLAGCYDKFGRGDVSNFLSGFNFLDTELYIDGQKAVCGNIDAYKQTLDMKDAVLSGSFEKSGAARVGYSFVSLRQLPYCGMLTVDVTALKDISLRAVNVQRLPEGFKNSVPQYEEIEVGHALSRLLSTEADSPTGRLKMAACSMFMFAGPQPRLAHERGEDWHGMSFAVNLKKGQTYRFAVVGSTMSSAQHPDAINEVKRLAIYCKMQGAERLLARHRSLWRDLWKSDVIVEGDKQSQQDIRNMIYHLYAFVREGSRLSISPMGLSGLGYNGHVFWDADTWMFPALLLLHPELARSMVDYRFDRLEAAKQYAFEHGYKGAMYVWESADSGFEDTPVFAMTGPFEHHVTGCVALAAWQYYCVARDTEWLRRCGYPILKETADYWLSRVEKGRDGLYHINNVVAADEWAENVDDNAFTNGAAKTNLLCAARAAHELGLEPNRRWTDVADSIAFVKSEGGVTMEYLGYKGQPIKQADVNLLAYPLKLVTDRKSIEADLEYYRTKVPEKETPAMTQAIFALLYSRLGNERLAWHYFKDSYVPNRLPPFGVIAETKGGTNPYFATGAGGTLQAVIMGFGGIDISYEGRGISQMPSLLPKKWKKLTFTSIGSERRRYTVANP